MPCCNAFWGRCMHRFLTCCFSRDAENQLAQPLARRENTSCGGLTRKRTSLHASLRVRCVERRRSDGQRRKSPVQVVVFDYDETLTMASFMSSGEDESPEDLAMLRMVNFESPWVPGERLQKVKDMLAALAQGPDGKRRALAILTKNGNKDGIYGVFRELRRVGLDAFFDALWIMPPRSNKFNGMFRLNGQWCEFHPPLADIRDMYKADILAHIVQNPGRWFPQFERPDERGPRLWLDHLRLESVVLVDDQRSNFQSPTGAQVLRYCKVARYDAEYRDLGFLTDMGGVGAHNDADFEALCRFVDDPFMCQESLEVRCSEMQISSPFCIEVSCDLDCTPVKVVVFDFDETLTLATFMPEDSACATQIGWTPEESSQDEWTIADLVTYNFESPFVEGSRVLRLRELLQDLLNLGMTLAVLTRNQSGAVAVLNLLKMAGLDMYFSAVWSIASLPGLPCGVCRQSNAWEVFEPPVRAVSDHPADVIQHVVQNSASWFPEMDTADAGTLFDCGVASVVLVDDERVNFRSPTARVLRYCKVARYDEIYRECGPMNQMGGIGAHSDEDYATLKAFVQHPEDFRYQPGFGDLPSPRSHRRERAVEHEDEDPFGKTPRMRSPRRSLQ